MDQMISSNNLNEGRMSRKKRDSAEKTELRTEEMGVSSVYYFADKDCLKGLYLEDITRIKKAFQVRIDIHDDKFNGSLRQGA